jgi:hypothetical protein
VRSDETTSPGENNDVPLSDLKEVGQIQIPDVTERIYCLSIIGQIEGQPLTQKTPNY